MTAAGPPIRAVLFDKDGTLTDFRATWEGWAAALARDLALEADVPVARVREALGIDEVERLRHDALFVTAPFPVTLAALAAQYGAEGPPKGEVVVVVGPPAAPAATDQDEIDLLLGQALEGESLRDAVGAVAAATGAPRKTVYARALARRAGGKDGAEVPYIPETQFSVGTGIEFSRWGLFVNTTYMDETFTTASNSPNPIDPNTGTPNTNYGTTDSYFVIDLSGKYKITDDFNAFINLHNVTDEKYIASRHPIGPRPGKPFSATLGIETRF